MTPFSVLLDAPSLPVSEIQIAKLGAFSDSRYGDFEITEADVAAWATNLEKLPGGKALIDFDHMSDKPSPHRNTEAAGWLTGVKLDEGIPKATVEWTPLGKSAIEEGRYRFFSPAYGPHRDETGTKHENVLSGGALTNKPFLGMAQVTLASDENVKQATLEGVDLPHLRLLYEADPKVLLDVLDRAARQAADSRPPMELTAITKALDLAEDADEQKVLDAIQTLQDEGTKPEKDDEPTKTLDQLAKDEGKIVLDSTEYGQLKDGAAAGIESKKQLDALTLDTAFTKALEAGKAVAADRDFYEELPLDVAVKRLEAAPQIVNVTAIGKNHDTLLGGDAPAGVHGESFQLDQAVKKHMEEHDETDYVKALHTVEDLQRKAA